jgi:hypothetical protein
MRSKQTSSRTSAKEIGAKRVSPLPRKPAPPDYPGIKFPPIVVPARTAKDDGREAEYIANLILTLAVKYVRFFLKTKPDVPRGWERQAITVLLLRDLTCEIGNLMFQPPETIIDVLNQRAHNCFGYMEGLTHKDAVAERANAKSAQTSKAKEH